jgi:hypothetical protein
MRLFSYCIQTDDDAAPNPFWGLCTLTICKPVIRRVAEVGDWIVGIGSVNVDVDGEDFSGRLLYAKNEPIKTEFISWLERKYSRNKLYGDPQVRLSFIKDAKGNTCASKRCDEAVEDEEIFTVNGGCLSKSGTCYKISSKCLCLKACVHPCTSSGYI